MQNVNALLVGAAAATLVVVALLGTSADGRQSLYTVDSIRHSFLLTCVLSKPRT